MEYESYYDYLIKNDIMGWLKKLWNGGGYYMNDDGVLEPHKSQIAIDSPWVHHGHASYANCLLWHQIMFDVVGHYMPQIFEGSKRFVPSGCQECYKVVVRPQTVLQLFALDLLMAETDRPCKCGIERREYTECKGYGGYFYNHGLEAGKECYEWVRKQVDEWPDLGPDVPIILKRACTEMEMALGPSNEWEITPGQFHVEELVMKHVQRDRERDQLKQPQAVIDHVKRSWLEFAAQRGDMTYMEFTAGKPINKPMVTYHDKED